MSDMHKPVPEASDSVLRLIGEKMSAFIFPNKPRTDEEKEAFHNAVYFQYEHEATRAMSEQNIPEGVESFRLGDFSMTFDKAFLVNRLTKDTICPSAYGALLRVGLLYRGVEGRL